MDGDGYRHSNPYGAGNYVGVCAPTHPNHAAICNDKLIGAWPMVGSDARDDNGHGSHTASTAAGNRHEATSTVGSTSHKLWRYPSSYSPSTGGSFPAPDRDGTLNRAER